MEPTAGLEPTDGMESPLGLEPTAGLEPTVRMESPFGMEPTAWMEPAATTATTKMINDCDEIPYGVKTFKM